MGILRADRIAGLGGANAITGSCFFDVKNYLFINYDISLDGDFTIEWWTHRNTGVTNSDWFTIGDAKESNGLEVYIGTSGAALKVYSNNGAILTANSGSPSENAWHHMAVVRSSNTIKIYVDGTVDSTTVSNSSTFTGFIRLGAEFYNGSATIRSKMHMSNFRIVKGTALYTSNFTPPNTRLESITGTEVLCCQSSGNILQEATGKTIVAERAASALTSSNVEASRFTPNSPVGFSTTTDVGSQYGSTFDGFGSFATSTYMVPPGGNTRERNRGRAVFGGGYAGGPSPAGAQTEEMSFLQIQSQGNSQDFGDLTAARWIPASCSSSTRGTWSGGATPSRVNTIDFVTIANTSNATDFGDLTGTRTYFDACSNQTRGITGAGDDGSNPKVNTMDLIIIATAGNATDFGDATAAKSNVVSTSSPTRGLLMGGYTPSNINNVDFITIATTGNAQDFGDMTAPTQYGSGSSSNTRAIYAGGYSPDGSTYSNKIEFFTIASAGNGTDFGDLITARLASGSTSNGTRGVIAGGFTPSPTFNINSIEFYTIATLGNAQDFGDITNSKRGIGACSDSHGGLS